MIKDFNTFHELNEGKNEDVLDIKQFATLLKTGEYTVKELQNKVAKMFGSKKLVYDGIEFFDTIYMDKLIPQAKANLEIGSYGEYEKYDDEGDSETISEKITGQEVYLGYLPHDDVFISGWDIFEPFEDYTNIEYLEVDSKHGDKNSIKIKQSLITNQVHSVGMFYDKYDGFVVVKQQHSKHGKGGDIIHLRLD